VADGSLIIMNLNRRCGWSSTNVTPGGHRLPMRMQSMKRYASDGSIASSSASMIRVTPAIHAAEPHSKWSTANRKRYALLKQVVD